MKETKRIFDFIGVPITPAIITGVQQSMKVAHGPTLKDIKVDGLNEQYYGPIMDLPMCSRAESIHRTILAANQRAG